MAWIDLHSHVLPGMDDGARTPDISGSMVSALHGLGFSDICATPHQKLGQFLPDLDAIDGAFAALVATTPAATLHLAAENMWDDVFCERAARGVVPSYRQGPAFLFELYPSILPVGLVDTLFRMRLAGKVPVLAHPERYEALWDHDDLARSLRQQCAFAVDLPALAGYHGKRQCKAARHLVDIGLATAAASDAHSVEDVERAAEGIRWIEKHHGSRTVSRLLGDAPRAILSGDLPD